MAAQVVLAGPDLVHERLADMRYATGVARTASLSPTHAAASPSSFLAGAFSVTPGCVYVLSWWLLFVQPEPQLFLC